MRVLTKKNLVTFWNKHPLAEQPLKAWYDEANKVLWKTPQDIKNQHANASIIGNNRVVFNIKGNDYRLIASIAYKFGLVYVKFVGTHAEYDKIDATTVEME